VYLAGGIAPLLIDKLKDGSFLDAFRRKGRLEPVLGRIPVHVIMSSAVGLLGAGAVAAGA
jgi:glucokinase